MNSINVNSIKVFDAQKQSYFSVIDKTEIANIERVIEQAKLLYPVGCAIENMHNPGSIEYRTIESHDEHEMLLLSNGGRVFLNFLMKEPDDDCNSISVMMLDMGYNIVKTAKIANEKVECQEYRNKLELLKNFAKWLRTENGVSIEESVIEKFLRK